MNFMKVPTKTEHRLPNFLSTFLLIFSLNLSNRVSVIEKIILQKSSMKLELFSNFLIPTSFTCIVWLCSLSLVLWKDVVVVVFCSRTVTVVARRQQSFRSQRLADRCCDAVEATLAFLPSSEFQVSTTCVRLRSRKYSTDTGLFFASENLLSVFSGARAIDE